MAKSKKKRTPVGRPITPAVLSELKALGAWPGLDRAFQPAGRWRHSYRIWTCHGYVASGNSTVGALRIERESDDDGAHTLRARQRVMHSGGITHSLHAEMRCRNDAVGSLTGWTLKSKYSGGKRPDGADLASSRTGAFADGVVTLSAGRETHTLKTPGPVTSDWSLFEAVQRMPRKGQSPTFDVLEHLVVPRPRHRIRYVGVEPVDWSGTSIKLHHYAQLGQGMLPYEYWLDTDRRLVVVATGARAYILDPNAYQTPGAPAGGRKDKRS